jgi:acetoacetyl-CoA synthetase
VVSDTPALSAGEARNPTWFPDANSGKALGEFLEVIKAKHQVPDLQALHRWSVDHSNLFWSEVWNFFGVLGDQGNLAQVESKLPETNYFPEARLSHLENLLAGGGSVSVISESDSRNLGVELSHLDLIDKVSALAALFLDEGIGELDRVVAILPVGIEVLVTTLASFEVGATVATASPEFGAEAIIARFAQLEPKVLVFSNSYSWQGREIDRSEIVAHVARALPSLKLVIGTSGNKELPESVLWERATSAPGQLSFTRRGFNHPAYVLFTSGTTGAPKGLLHRSGGILLKHLVEMKLHCDIRAGDRVSFYTTTGWMMWNWDLSILATGADLLLFDGSPTFPDSLRLFHFAKEQNLTHLGLSARLLDLIREQHSDLKSLGELPNLRVIMVTGSPLSQRTGQWLSDQFGGRVLIAPFSGGTDLVGSFMGPNPLLPYYAGQMQGALLGMDIDCWTEQAERCEVDQIGELVCKSSFPTVPLGIWGDLSGQRFAEAYFHRWKNIWVHGDLVSRTREGGYVVHGRSDATLNVGGVRIGTGEIYAALEPFKEISGALAFTQPWNQDERITLLVVATGVSDRESFVKRIKSEIKSKCSPRHMPGEVLFVSDLPRTFNGKLAEVAVSDLAHRRPIRNLTSLVNPEALAEIEKSIFNL